MPDNQILLANAPDADPDLPVVVISRSIAGDMSEMEQNWVAAQARLVQGFTLARHVQATTSDHYIQLSQPEEISALIERMLENDQRN